MIGLKLTGEALPLTSLLSWTPREEPLLEKSWVLVLSSPWDSQETVALSVSLSLWTVPGAESTSVTVKISKPGWRKQETLFGP